MGLRTGQNLEVLDEEQREAERKAMESVQHKTTIRKADFESSDYLHSDLAPPTLPPGPEGADTHHAVMDRMKKATDEGNDFNEKFKSRFTQQAPAPQPVAAQARPPARPQQNDGDDMRLLNSLQKATTSTAKPKIGKLAGLPL